MIRAYKVGVTVSAIDGVSSVLRGIGRTARETQHQVDQISRGMTSARAGALAFGAAMASIQVLGAMSRLADEGERLVHQQALLGAAGNTSAQVADATADAWRATGDVIGSTVSQNVAAIADIRNLTGDIASAQALMPHAQRISQLVGLVSGKPAEASGAQIMRAVELRGGILGADGKVDQARLEASMSAATRMIVATRGQVSAPELVQFVQQARTAGRSITDEAFFTTMPSVINAMGGARAGTGLAAFFRQMVGGVMTDEHARNLQAMGLIQRAGPTRTITADEYKRLQAAGKLPEGSHTAIRSNGMVAVTPSSMVGRDLAMRDPVAWIEQYLKPAMERAGFTGDRQADGIYRIGGSEVGRGFIDYILSNLPSIRRDQANIAAVPTDAFERLQRESPVAAQQAFTSAFTNLTAALTEPVVPIAAGYMTTIAGALRSVTTMVQANPGVAKTIVGVGVGLAGVLAVLGTAAAVGSAVAFIGGAAVIGPAMAVVGGIAAAVVAWKAIPWTEVGRFGLIWATTLYTHLIRDPAIWVSGMVTTGFTTVRDALQLTITTNLRWLKEGSDALIGFVGNFSPNIAAAMTKFRDAGVQAITDIVAWIADIPGRIARSLQGEGAGSNPAAQAERNGRMGGRGAAGGFYPGPAVDPDTGDILQRLVPPPGAGQPRARQMSAVPPPRAAETVIPMQINLDGEAVYRGTTRRLARDANRPPTGSARPDSGMTPFYPGSVGASV